jgi:hypothetical protein
VEVIRQLGRGVQHYSVARRWTTCMWIGLSKINSISGRRRINISIIIFFPSCSSINLHSSSSVLLTCLSNAELIIFRTSLKEGDGLGHTSGIISGLMKMIGVVSLRIVPYRVTSQHESKSSSRLARYASNALRLSSVKESNVGLRILPLLRSDLMWLEFPPFMLDVLEVVNSPTKSPKCVAIQNEQGP